MGTQPTRHHGSRRPHQHGGRWSIRSAEQVCQAAVTALAADGAALTAVTDKGHRATLAASGHLSTRITELQLTTGTGPCLDAHHQHHLIPAPDLSSAASQTRWPGFAAAAVDQLGVWAVFSFPLLAGAHCAGTLMVYRHRLGRLTANQLRNGFSFADAGLWALLDTRAGLPDGAPLPALGGGQDEIHQAAGIVSVQLGVGIDEALVRLRAHAWAAEQPLSETARAVIAHRLLLAAP